MVGILGAFALNNWHENMKIASRENQLLNELAVNLESNVQAFENNIIQQKDIIRRIDTILVYLEDRRSYHDSLAFDFRSLIYLEQITVSTSAYETLKSAGFSIIQSNNLRTEIIQLFEMMYPSSVNLVRDVSMQRYDLVDIPH